MIKTLVFAAAAATLALAGCATGPTVPAGMKAGEFVNYACEGGKRFAARAATDGASVRIRYEGGYELDNKGNGVYEAEGWRLSTTGGAAQLDHNGKTVVRNCRPA